MYGNGKIQVVEKRKELQKKVSELNEEVSKLRKNSGDMQQLVNQCDELQTSNLVLRRQLAKFQEVSTTLESTAAKNVQLVGLYLSLRLDCELEQHNAYTFNLLSFKNICYATQAEEVDIHQKTINSLKEQCSSVRKVLHQETQTDCDEPEVDHAEDEELQTLKDRVVDLELENHDLRGELEGFDASFFEEIEEMKQEHHQLTLKVIRLSLHEGRLVKHWAAQSQAHTSSPCSNQLLMCLVLVLTSFLIESQVAEYENLIQQLTQS